jgi:hypothetical protein
MNHFNVFWGCDWTFKMQTNASSFHILSLVDLDLKHENNIQIGFSYAYPFYPCPHIHVKIIHWLRMRNKLLFIFLMNVFTFKINHALRSTKAFFLPQCLHNPSSLGHNNLLHLSMWLQTLHLTCKTLSFEFTANFTQGKFKSCPKMFHSSHTFFSSHKLV